MPRNDWTREETIVAFNIYCKIPFKSSSKTNPIIIKFAKILDRSPSALNMKIGNFGRLDPELKNQGISGLTHGSRLEEEIWEEFNGNWEKLAYESELLISKFSKKPIEKIAEIKEEEIDFLEGKEKETIIKKRVNQNFFRAIILSSYNIKCCITDISIPELLVAGHIKPWSEDIKNRTNPRNGLCLNVFHEKAFDEGYFTIDLDYKIKTSKYLREYKGIESVNDFLLKYEGKKINLPDRFIPSKEFLEYHYNSKFKK